MGERCKYVIGVDFGSDSVRAVLVDALHGGIVNSTWSEYPRWKERKYCDGSVSMFRQHPQDYLDSMKECVSRLTSECGKDVAENIAAIGFDTTGSTPCPVNRHGVPLSLLPEFSDNPNAMFYLWKDHTAVREAEEVNEILSHNSIEDFTKFQGIYSAEWYWSKILHGVRTDKSIREYAYTWIEHADWMPAVLSGRTRPEIMYHCSCAAGHKALWNSEFHGLPDLTVLESIDPYLRKVGERFGNKPEYSTSKVGIILPEWAEILGLPKTTFVAGSSLDAHAGAVGSGIRKNILVEVMGTSAVGMLVQDPEVLKNKNLKAICGQAEDSILPGHIGIEASQAAFGDIYSWFSRMIVEPMIQYVSSSDIPEENKKSIIDGCQDKLLKLLDMKLSKLPAAQNVVSVDWFNGRRYPDINEDVKGGIYGLTLGTDYMQVYQSLVLATIYGAKRVFDSFVENGMVIDGIIAAGGISQNQHILCRHFQTRLTERLS